MILVMMIGMMIMITTIYSPCIPVRTVPFFSPRSVRPRNASMLWPKSWPRWWTSWWSFLPSVYCATWSAATCACVTTDWPRQMGIPRISRWFFGRVF